MENRFQELYKKALNLHKANKHEESIQVFEELLELKPRDGKALYNFANVLADYDRLEEALEYYDRAIEVNDAIASVWFNRANVLADLEFYEEAEKSYKKAIDLNPTADKVFNLGVCYTEMGRLNQAIKSYQYAIELDDLLHYAWYNLACVLALENDIRGSLRCLKSAIDRQGDDIEYREMAIDDPHFAKIWERAEFKQLVH